MHCLDMCVFHWLNLASVSFSNCSYFTVLHCTVSYELSFLSFLLLNKNRYQGILFYSTSRLTIMNKKINKLNAKDIITEMTLT